MAWIKALIGGLCLFSHAAYADFLPPDQAFQFQAISTSHDRAELTWNIAPGYYLYHEQLKVKQDQQSLSLQLPTPQAKDDPNFGMTEVHYGQVKTVIAVQPDRKYTVEWQGCAESGLCYPVQRINIQTGADGLLPVQHISPEKKLLGSATTHSTPSNFLQTLPESDPKGERVQDNQRINTVENPVTESVEQTSFDATDLPNAQISQDAVPWNNDQFFFNLLSAQGLGLNLLLFLGLGVLLAFLPCSLPLIPILSGILVQQHRGYRAAMIALTFVIGMASVYAMMGFAVAQLGYSFQRWFQSPFFIGLFSLLFVLFALNLFGAFQLSLPRGMLQKLDDWQQRQKGGTWVGAAIMGMLAALIVGPCMSAPLAGALLFVSQLNQPILGASYLFVLGLGIGLPLFIAAVFGAQYLPKPGQWMDRLKFSFGFVMLGLAIYFARPFLPILLYFLIMAGIALGFAIYVMWKMWPHVQRPVNKVLLVLLSIGLLLSSAGYVYQAIQQKQVALSSQKLSWHHVNTAQDLQQLLAQYPDQAMVIDVYADWCVACQPIERQILPQAAVQALLQDVLRIKLDLTHYHASQDQLLKDWQILGPPTFIFLNAEHEEQRQLRLTGTFSSAQLQAALHQLNPNGEQ